jgi:hypothetical protein
MGFGIWDGIGIGIWNWNRNGIWDLGFGMGWDGMGWDSHPIYTVKFDISEPSVLVKISGISRFPICQKF